MGMPPPALLLVMVIFIGVCVWIENAFIGKRRRRMKRAYQEREAALEAAEGHREEHVGVTQRKARARGEAPHRTRPREMYAPNSPFATIGIAVVIGGVILTRFGWITGLVVVAMMLVAIFAFSRTQKHNERVRETRSK